MVKRSPATVFGFVILFMLVLFSYQPIQGTISSLASNNTTTNAVIEFLDSWFALVWVTLGILILAVAIYTVLMMG